MNFFGKSEGVELCFTLEIYDGVRLGNFEGTLMQISIVPLLFFNDGILFCKSEAFYYEYLMMQ